MYIYNRSTFYKPNKQHFSGIFNKFAIKNYIIWLANTDLKNNKGSTKKGDKEKGKI